MERHSKRDVSRQLHGVPGWLGMRSWRDGGAASSPTEDSHAQCQSESPQTVAMDTTSFRSWGRAQRAGVARASHGRHPRP